jgi:hypothetical protein
MYSKFRKSLGPVFLAIKHFRLLVALTVHEIINTVQFHIQDEICLKNIYKQ